MITHNIFHSKSTYCTSFENILLISSSDFPLVSGTQRLMKTVPSSAMAEKMK